METVKYYRWGDGFGGGIVLATSAEDAKEKLEKKYSNPMDRRGNFNIWPWEDDDYYDAEHPCVFDIYG